MAYIGLVWLFEKSSLTFFELKAVFSPRDPGEGKYSGTRDQQGEPSTHASMPQTVNAGGATGAGGPRPAVVKSGEGNAVTGASAPSPAPWLTLPLQKPFGKNYQRLVQGGAQARGGARREIGSA